MTRSVSPRAGAFLLLGALGLIGALVARNPALVALTAPFLVLAGVGLADARSPGVRMHLSADAERVLEGESVVATLEVTAARTLADVEVLLLVPGDLELADGENPTVVRLEAGKPCLLELRLTARRFGGYTLGGAHVRARWTLGFHVWDGYAATTAPVRVYPHEEAIDRLLSPAQTQLFAGDERSRRLGEGIEFAGLRPFAYGDALRRINWRASARRGEPWVNDQHPERNADVVLFLDTFAEVRLGPVSTLDETIRAAAALARHYLQRRDRVGLVSFGGVLRWLRPSAGTRQLYRITDALLDTDIVQSFAERDIEVIPRRMLPPNALVVALTAFLDRRTVEALFDLRARAYDLAVIEVDPTPGISPGTTRNAQLARRVWEIQRATTRARYLAAGVPVSRWTRDRPLAAVVHELGVLAR